MLGCDDAGFADIQAIALNAAIKGSILAEPEASILRTSPREGLVRRKELAALAPA
jgi:hypothetical protein